MFRKVNTRKRKVYDWPAEIAKGNRNKFYKSTAWNECREKVLFRDKYTCQFFSGDFEQYGYKTNNKKLVRANTVHHIKPIKTHPELCLNIDNLVSLSHEAHEIIEGRADILREWNEKNRKELLTEEQW